MATRPARRQGGVRVPTASPPRRLVRQGASAPDRQALFRRWALAGAGSGAAIAILRAPFAWAGDGVAANIGNLAGHVLIFTLLALAGCWVWQRQQAS